MALIARTGYTPDTRYTTTDSGPALPGPPQGTNFSALFDLARQLYSAQPGYGGGGQAPGPRRNLLGYGSMSRPSLPAPSMAGGLTGRQAIRPMPTALDNAREAAQIAQLRALSEPPPMRYMTGASVIPGPVMDVTQMTGAQRQMFLPDKSVPGDLFGGTLQEQQQRQAEHDAWRNIAPGEGPWSENFAGQEAQRQEMELIKEQIRAREMARAQAARQQR